VYPFYPAGRAGVDSSALPLVALGERSQS